MRERARFGKPKTFQCDNSVLRKGATRSSRGNLKRVSVITNIHVTS